MVSLFVWPIIRIIDAFERDSIERLHGSIRIKNVTSECCAVRRKYLAKDASSVNKWNAMTTATISKVPEVRTDQLPRVRSSRPKIASLSDGLHRARKRTRRRRHPKTERLLSWIMDDDVVAVRMWNIALRSLDRSLDTSEGVDRWQHDADRRASDNRGGEWTTPDKRHRRHSIRKLSNLFGEHFVLDTFASRVQCSIAGYLSVAVGYGKADRASGLCIGDYSCWFERGGTSRHLASNEEVMQAFNDWLSPLMPVANGNSADVPPTLVNLAFNSEDVVAVKQTFRRYKVAMRAWERCLISFERWN
jgi:hypothetical protein